MSFVRYKVGQQEQFVQFDQYFDLHRDIFKTVVDLAGYSFEEGIVEEPLIKVSILPPKNIKQWDQKYFFKSNEQIVIFSKRKNSKIYIYFYCIMNINLVNLPFFLFKIVITNMILQNKNLLYLHGMLLNSGDIIFSGCMGGKSTLTYRINNNQKLKSICDDGLLIDTKNNLVYPINYIWGGWEDPFAQEVVSINNPLKLKELFLLRQSEQQKIIEIDKEEWLKECYDNTMLFYYHPFNLRNTKEKTAQKWTDLRSQLFEEVKNDTIQKVKFFQKFKPLVLTTNTPDINKKFEVIPDVI